MHIFMKFSKHLLFVYFFISFEFSLDNFLGSLISNESENHFNIINTISFYVEVFLSNSEILIHSPNLQRRLFGKGYYTQQEYHILYNQIFFSVFFFIVTKILDITNFREGAGDKQFFKLCYSIICLACA